MSLYKVDEWKSFQYIIPKIVRKKNIMHKIRNKNIKNATQTILHQTQ